MNSGTSFAGPPIDRPVVKILIGVHGYESEGYGFAVSRAVHLWTASFCRVVAVFDTWTPGFTSLLPASRAAYDAGAAHLLKEDHERVERAVAEAEDLLPDSSEIVLVRVWREDPARIIAEQARSWSADAVVVSPPRKGFDTWLWPGAVHERVVHCAPCPVLVVSPVTPHPDTPSNPVLWLRSLLSRRGSHTLHRAG